MNHKKVKKMSFRQRMKALTKTRLEIREKMKKHLLEEKITTPNGRRIVDISYLFKGIQEISDHGEFSCSFKDMVLISEIQRGFQSGFEFRCQLCSLTKTIWSESSTIPVNAAAVEGIRAVNRGFTSLERFSSALNIPCDISVYQYATPQAQTAHRSNSSRLKRIAPKKSHGKEDGVSINDGVLDWTKILLGKSLKSLSEVSSEKESKDVAKTEPNLDLGLQQKIVMTTVIPSYMVVVANPTTFITPHIDPSYLSAPGPSSRMEPNSSMTEQDVRLALTCEVYPPDDPQPVLLTKVKEEPIDIDEHKQDILFATVREGSSVTNSQVGSLLQPPVLIKEEPVYSEEEL